MTPTSPSMIIVAGDLLGQDVEVIVNPWNRNIIPWLLLLPQGVSGATDHYETGTVLGEQSPLFTRRGNVSTPRCR